MALQRLDAEGGGIGLRFLEVVVRFAFEDLELGGGEGRLAQHLAEQTQHRRQVLPLAFDGERHLPQAACRRDAGLQPVQLVLELLRGCASSCRAPSA